MSSISADQVRAKLRVQIAQLPAILEMNIGDYFANCRLRQSQRAALERRRGFTIVEFVALVISDSDEEYEEYEDDWDVLGSIERTPMNHFEAILELCEDLVE